MATDGGATCEDGNLSDPALLSGHRIECAQIEIALPAVEGECSYEAKGVELDQVRLRVSAQADCVLSLSGLVAHDARIELVGPVSLVIDDRAVLENASFTGERTTDGAPLLDLDLVEGQRVVVGDAGQVFEGALQARHTRLRDSTMNVEEIALESTLFESVLLEGRAVDAVDAVIQTGVIDLGSAVFSACSLRDVDIRSCTTLLIAGGAVQRALLRGCGENRYRIYNTRLGQVSLDGWVESDSSTFFGLHLGLHSPTDFVQFGGGIDKGAFCSHMRSYRIGEKGYVKCVSCDEPGTLEPGGACWVSPVERVSPGSACAPLAELADCSDENVSAHRPRPYPPMPVE